MILFFYLWLKTKNQKHSPELKLNDGRGYEFLRTDGRSTSRLVLIPGSKVEGYSVQYLKDNLNQATAYICPLQNDLSLSPLEDFEVGMIVSQ